MTIRNQCIRCVYKIVVYARTTCKLQPLSTYHAVGRSVSLSSLRSCGRSFGTARHYQITNRENTRNSVFLPGAEGTKKMMAAMWPSG